MRIAINGMGRIGRLLFRLLLENGKHDLVAVNDIMEPENLLYLLKYDSISGPYPHKLELKDQALLTDNKSVKVLNQAHPEKLPWNELNIDLVVECAGRFTTMQLAGKHLEAGAKKVLLSTTGSEDMPLIIWGVNNEILSKENKILSPGGCMTNCSGTVLKPLLDHFGIESVQINFLHSYTSRQSLVDAPHSNYRRGRAAATSIIPVEIDLAHTLERLFPNLESKVAATSTRVPIACGAFADFSVILKKTVSVAEMNDLFKVQSENQLRGILQYNEEKIVSNDTIGNSHSAIFDSTLTSIVGGHHCKISAWFDNEFGYTNRLIDIIG
ncbi:MAG: type I glyceraldehyde-3-phosphate dehydrogenase [Bacteroidetes bacterium]|nr:MAG: type I glyceraldehyde-3-phosphate dehydrogenase [Bacteroidota bacterium]